MLLILMPLILHLLCKDNNKFRKNSQHFYYGIHVSITQVATYKILGM